jgi:ComF family protein
MLGSFLDLLFPPKCPFCGRLLEDGQTLLCPDCQRDLPWMQGERMVEFVDLCAAPLWYRDKVRQSHHRYKFSGLRSYARVYSVLMAQCAADRLDGRFDLVTWAPLSAKRLRKRGYDQSRLLAEGVALGMGMQAVPLLDKVRDTPAQSGLEGDSVRRANVLGAYSLRPEADVQGRRILLVDDVMTTGATLSECARILRTAGAEQVVCLTLAMARPDSTHIQP